MATICKQNMPDLVHNNRFFDDNHYLAMKYGPGYITVEKENKETSNVNSFKVDECA